MPATYPRDRQHRERDAERFVPVHTPSAGGDGKSLSHAGTATRRPVRRRRRPRRRCGGRSLLSPGGSGARRGPPRAGPVYGDPSGRPVWPPGRVGRVAWAKHNTPRGWLCGPPTRSCPPRPAGRTGVRPHRRGLHATSQLTAGPSANGRSLRPSRPCPARRAGSSRGRTRPARGRR